MSQTLREWDGDKPHLGPLFSDDIQDNQMSLYAFGKDNFTQ